MSKNKRMYHLATMRGDFFGSNSSITGSRPGYWKLSKGNNVRRKLLKFKISFYELNGFFYRTLSKM